MWTSTGKINNESSIFTQNKSTITDTNNRVGSEAIAWLVKEIGGSQGVDIFYKLFFMFGWFITDER